jgi:hypothetical protein
MALAVDSRCGKWVWKRVSLGGKLWVPPRGAVLPSSRDIFWTFLKKLALCSLRQEALPDSSP